ncbi:hypothetical protein ACHAWF_007589 [Thalassiosira exigua]
MVTFLGQWSQVCGWRTARFHQEVVDRKASYISPIPYQLGTPSSKHQRVPKFHHDSFKYLIRYSIIDRVKSLHVKREHVGNIFEIGLYYEQLSKLKEATSVLELALWKASIGQPQCDVSEESSKETFERKQSCRIRCGSDVIIPNVLTFLLPVVRR